MTIDMIDYRYLYVRLDCWCILGIIIIYNVLIKCVFWLRQSKVNGNTVSIDGFNFSFPYGSISFKMDNTTYRLAYLLWVEIVTRKIGLEFEEDKDVIVEVYNSWYESFKSIRNMLEEINTCDLRNVRHLVDLTVRILNDGMRPHLTTWQAKFRAWYEEARRNYPDKTPQEIQRMYPEYEELIHDLKRANKDMMEFASIVKKIAFKE